LFLSNQEKLAFKSEPSNELRAEFPASSNIYPVLRTPAPFDDFDASVTIRFIDGDYDQISAGLELRFNDESDYVIRISAQGTFSVGWHEKTDWGGYLVKWTSHPVLRSEMGESNWLRVIMKGKRISVYGKKPKCFDLWLGMNAKCGLERSSSQRLFPK
jgi:hypothetical protein